ncbi:MAG: hypothetical protein LBD11_01095 [Candidatus Peribacteria bacterium]|jgi:hypothetical protein|nr:hypothetical protein [Candidatus Peribacteria bacterium]
MLKKIVYARILLLLSTAGITYADSSTLSGVLILTNAVSTDTSREVSTTYKTKVINLYCEKALTNQVAFLLTGETFRETFRYSSRDSLFLRALCGARNPTNRGKEDLTKDIFKENFTKKLNLQQFKSNKDLCATGSGTNENNQSECDLSRYSSKIYQALMSDIFKIKRAEVLQVPSTEVFKNKEDRIASIFDTYFSMNNSDKSAYQKLYPKTVTMIDNNQKIIYKSLQSLSLLDNEGLRKKSQEADTKCPIEGTGFENFACGLHLSGDQKKGLNTYFTNFLTNEYLNYRLFTDFYINWLRTVQTDQEKTALLIELNAIVQQREMFETALQTSLKELQEIATTYPLHIGLVLYQEEALKFRDKYAAKLVTPFYTLYEKLRNVQPPY